MKYVEGRNVEEERWAAAHYRIERESSGVVMRKRQRRKATVQAIQFGDPVPDDPHDVVRIYDRAGTVVFEQDWGTNRAGALAHEARIVEDLLHLDTASFRGRYGITSEPPPVKPAAKSRSSPKPRKRTAGAARRAPRAPGRPKRGSG